MSNPVRFYSISPELIEVHWPEKIEEGILLEILVFEKVIMEEWKEKIRSIHHGYQVLGIQLKENFDAHSCMPSLKELWESSQQNPDLLPQRQEWKFPVCYDRDLVPELDLYLEKSGLEHTTFVEKHTANAYLLYFYGFLPGFMYLGCLDECLHVPRKAIPDKKIPSGSVAIGGSQTGVYPMDSPGGWYVVGKTPVGFFQNGALKLPFSAGDRIRFEAITRKEYDKLIATENFDWRKTPYHG
ncbi:5-oxoprolinase subunit B family protein [Cyclobacterium sp. SYSU L10401]|uniref:5-oxoprolinase subunit B family protein n=1 Tax=Cyclobacterium sp. SYSU L10401 TaxID=2678657 RepID=UPI0013D57A97|nr:carboxyltransferase domain-containing protein [Cyclobacterium sp. SYSU L10401]